MDYGLIFQFNNKRYYEIIWDSEYFQFGLNVKEKKQLEEIERIKIWDVSNDFHWTNILERKIKSVNIHWKSVEQENRIIDYPQDIEMVFEMGKIYLYQHHCIIKTQITLVNIQMKLFYSLIVSIAKKYNVVSKKFIS